MPVGQFPKPKPNKLIQAMQLLINKEPIGINRLYPSVPQHYIGTWLQAEPLDANLSVVRLQGGVTVHFVAKSTSQTFVANDVVKLERSTVLPLHIVGKLVGNINLASQTVNNVAAPGAPTSAHTTDVQSSGVDLAWNAGVDHFGAGLSYQIFLNGKFKQSVGIGILAGTISHLTASTNYTVNIKAMDGAGNVSVNSNTVSFTTDATPAPPGGTSVTKSYKASGLRSYNYNGANERDTWHDNQCYQGAVDGSANQYGLIDFNWALIHSQCNGKNITGAAVYVTYAHWYLNSGGFADIGTHNYQSLPSSKASGANLDPRLFQVKTTAGARLKVDLGVAIAQDLVSGARKGIAIGPGANTGNSFYGYIWGAGPNVPVLHITYTE